MSQKLDPEDLRLLKIIGLSVFLIVSMFITFGIGSLIHEGGHAGACIALGGNVGGFRHWLRGAWSLAPATDCSIKPLPPFVWAGGDITTILGWLLSVVTLIPLLNKAIIKRGLCRSMLWAWWSFWYFSTLFREARNAYAPLSVWEDTTQFVHITGINPNLIGLPLAAILIASLWIWWRIQYWLLAESFLSYFYRFRLGLVKTIERSPLPQACLGSQRHGCSCESAGSQTLRRVRAEGEDGAGFNGAWGFSKKSDSLPRER